MIVFAEEALADLERIFEFNFARDPATALDHIEKVRSAILVLEAHTEIGRPVPGSTLRVCSGWWRSAPSARPATGPARPSSPPAVAVQTPA